MFLGTFIEEILSPIPSFMVLVPAGAAAAARGYGYEYLLVLMICSAAGRIIGSVILYSLAYRLEGAMLSPKRRLFGISKAQIEQVGKRINGRQRRDWAVLFILNALPIFPTAMLSLVCGFLKVNFKMFAFCSFFGTMINALIFMSIGYAGVQVVETLQGIQLAGRITSGGLLIAAIVWVIVYRRSRRA